MLKECIKELHSTHTTLNQVSTNMEADLESAQGLSERRGKELAALQQVVEADARDWIKETIVGHCIVGACERRVLNGERYPQTAAPTRCAHEYGHSGGLLSVLFCKNCAHILTPFSHPLH